MIINIVRKPLVGSVTKNITLYNIGGINIDQTRIGTEGGRTNKGDYQNNFVGGKVEYDKGKGVESDHTPKGRFPSNVVLSESSVPHLPVATQGHWANAKVTGYGDVIGSGSVEYFGVGEKDQTGGTVDKYFLIIQGQ